MFSQMRGLIILLTNKSISKSSTAYISFLILKEMKKKKIDRMSVYDLYKLLKANGINSSRQLTLGLSFLYSVNIIDFEEAHIWIRK
jgi:hypothetical protein